MNYREAASLAVTGGLLPLATIYAMVLATAEAGVPGIAALFLLVFGPLFVAVGVYLTAVRTGRVSAPRWLPVAGPDEFRDRVPERYHEEFSPETLAAPAEEPPESSGRLVALALVYLISVPAYALAFWVLFG